MAFESLSQNWWNFLFETYLVCLIINFVIIYLMFDSSIVYRCYVVKNYIHPSNLIAPIDTIGSQEVESPVCTV